ncbi:MAG: hypothetical protein ACJAS9_001305 [Polaribacter sp.]|jgi:hypothetical protein
MFNQLFHSLFSENFTNKQLKTLFLAACLLGLTACGGGSGTTEPEVVTTPPDPGTECSTQDEENDDDDCGTLLIGLTDADGDFLTYSVDVVGLELTREDGVTVSVLPSSQTIDFADYVEVSELAAAATIPAGIYTSGTITLDYTNADVQVEKDSEVSTALMVDTDGAALITETLDLQLDEGNRLVITRRVPALFEIDFNLAASHTVNLATDPIEVTTEPYIIAEVDPIVIKEFRVRGPLIQVDEAESFFRIAVRPFHHQSARNGGVNVSTNDETNYEIDGEAYLGAEGLNQIATMPEGTPTITFGVFMRAEDSFTAVSVVAGSSVPGADFDGATGGVVIARDGNTLRVKGASVIRTDGQVIFDDEISVIVAETTKVFKNRKITEESSITDISVGQSINVVGNMTQDGDELILDATEGVVKMNITFASGYTVSKDDATLDVDLQAIQGRKPELFDFAGTGIDSTFDAEVDNYEVNINNLIVSGFEPNDPVRVSGYIAPFATAPSDFNATSVINYAQSRSQIFVNWPDGDDVVAFSEINSDSMTINTDSSGEYAVYTLIQGGVRTDISQLENAVIIQPKGTRGLFTIKTETGITIFSNFADFTSFLQLKLDEGKVVDLMHTNGGFSLDSSTLSAVKVAVKLK